MKIAFIWQGFDGRYGMWQDGLAAAMRILAKEHTVRYFDFPLTGIDEFKPDVVLYWESPCTLKGRDAENYQSVMNLPYKKALLFAGGPVEVTTCHGFDLYFVESKINEEEFEALGLPWKRAFGVNTQIMKPQYQGKKWDGIIAATFADWKRHTLFAEALGDKGLAVGRLQEFDRNGYNRCMELVVNVMPEQTPTELAKLYNASHVAVNTSAFWGGGQRMTLEAMACGIPVIVMSDSPKNCEYVEESLGGMVVPPEPQAIRDAIEEIGRWLPEDKTDGVDYIQSKWTERHYAKALLEGIKGIL